MTMPLISTLLSCMLASHAAPPLGVASITPANVDAILQVRGGLPERAGPSMQMLRGWVHEWLAETGGHKQWEAAALQAKMTPSALMERCAGRDASLVLRRESTGPSWVLAMEMQGAQACAFLRSIGGRMQGSGRFDLPHLGLAGSWHGDWLLVTDRAESPLMRDMLRVASEPEQESFADALPQDRSLDSDASITMALRHGCGSKSLSLWSATPCEGFVRVNMQAVLSKDPFGATRDGDEASLIAETMPPETVACWIQPMPVNPMPKLWASGLSDWSHAAAVQASLGDRMIVAIGPREQDEGAMAIAVAYRVRDAQSSTRDHDRMIDRVASVMSRSMGQTSCQPLARQGLPLEAPRHCSEPGLAEAAFGGLDMVGAPELHARTVVLPTGGWRVYASDRIWLDRVAASLEEQPEQSPALCGPAYWNRSGMMDGHNLAACMSAWSMQRERSGRCAKSLRMIAAMAGQAGMIEWRTAQPEPGRIEAVLELHPALVPTRHREMFAESGGLTVKP